MFVAAIIFTFSIVGVVIAYDCERCRYTGDAKEQIIPTLNDARCERYEHIAAGY